MITLLTSLGGMLLTILIVVGFHELGHFLAARWLGVRVLRFSIGFGKALFSRRDKTGTEYVLAAIPLGGYVKMLDEGEETVKNADLPFAFNRQSFYKKFLIVAGGPLANFILAFGLYWLLFIIGFNSIAPIIGAVTPHSIAADAGLKPQQEIIEIDHKPTTGWMAVTIRLMSHVGEADSLQMVTREAQITRLHTLDLTHWEMNQLKPDPLQSLGLTPYSPPVPAIVGRILPDTPAAHSTLRMGDKIKAINHQPVQDWMDLITRIENLPDTPITLTVDRQGTMQTIQLTAAARHEGFFKKYGTLGIGADFHWPAHLLRDNKYSIGGAFIRAWQNTVDFTNLNIDLIGKLLTGKVSLQSLGGPISIFQSAGTALNQGIAPFLSFLAFLSISIGIINILPIPGLDGGHLLFQVIEVICRRPIPPRVLMLCYRLGMITLFILLSQAVVNDLLRL